MPVIGIPNLKKPWSYQLQQWILSNTFLTRNMKVLVYGVWDGQSQNIYPFTASYSEIKISSKKLQTPIDFVCRFTVKERIHYTPLK
jgi:hypothetical protein